MPTTYSQPSADAQEHWTRGRHGCPGGALLAIPERTHLRTSQLALPEDACRRVYATDGYGQSLRNLEQTSLNSDNVFSDGYSLQLAAR